MRKGKLTREQAIEIAGEARVIEVEGKNCDFSNRVQTDGDTAVEFEAAVNYTDNIPDGQDLSYLDWVIAGYDVV